ncbi:alpha/beta fold hydrolase [Streptomyces sp. RGM 3693]|uniref:alpha/beta fold hydrolase n=1 Tax=Streptomyces sp. RGM 3693 TaxID=3413284 RepID=UPI003D2BC9AC
MENGRIYGQVREGARPALVFLHYWGGSHRTWQRVIENLDPAQGYVAYDHRGWGESADVPGPYGIEQLADDAERVMNGLNYDEYLVVGHSMGGKVAQVLAGSDDKVDPPQVLREHLLPLIPTATLTELADTGHLSPLEVPDQIASHISTFTANLQHAVSTDPAALTHDAQGQ